MKKVRITLPKGCEVENVTTTVKNGMLVVEYEPKEAYKPKDGDIISFANGELGIFREKTLLSATFHVIYRPIGKLSYNSSPLFYNRERPAIAEERGKLFDALEKEGKCWNAENKSIEDLPRWRAEKGELYYFIVSAHTTMRGIEYYTDSDERRYNEGNYFKTREAAEKVAEQIRRVFKESKAE